MSPAPETAYFTKITFVSSAKIAKSDVTRRDNNEALLLIISGKIWPSILSMSLY